MSHYHIDAERAAARRVVDAVFDLADFYEWGPDWQGVPESQLQQRIYEWVAIADVSYSHIDRAVPIPGDPSNVTDLSASRAEGDEVRTLDADSKIRS